MRKLKILFLACLIAAAVYNLYQSYAQAIVQLQGHKTAPLHSLGYQFIGLENIFKGVHTVGYYTDKDLTDPVAIAQFEQAQYMLVPTVLDLNHTQYHFVIFDCTSPQAAMEAVQHLGFTAIKTHNNLVLAFNPNGV